MTQPLTPFIRSIDGFNPSDPAREWVLSGGVTTSLILPGSGNIIGGEAYTFKLRKVDTLSNEDMLVEAGVKDKWRYMKMACGENPKRFYGNFYHIMPSTRLGEGWLLRDHTPFPEDLQYESLVGILREDVRLNIHCYETHDLEAMVRHSNEYKFKIRAFHHALDAYRVPEILKRAYKNVPTVATFAGKFGYKKEAFQSSVNSPKILTDAGIAVAMKSDHPVLNSQHLIYEAAQARHYGLSEQLALASVTSVPAKALGLDHRIGKIAVGMDADVVIWSKHPLSLGAHPLQVYVDGISQIENADEKEWQQQSVPEAFPEFPKMKTPENDKNSCTPKAKTAIFTGLNKVYWGDMKEYQHASEGELKVVVRDGEVVCAGRCNDKVRELQRGGEDIPVYDLGGKGVAIPSLVAFAPPNLGLTEIAAEDSTGDGHPNLKSPLTYAADGLKFGGLHMNEAFKAGVLVSVTAPDSEHVIQGISTAFRTGAESTIVGDGIIKEQAALHVKIGQGVKSELFPTVSSQIAFLRTLLDKALNAHIESEYTPVINGKIPLVVEVNNRDEIIRVVELKKQLEKQGAKLRLTLFGAVEAWTVAEYLAENHVGVVLKPYKCTPVEWTAQKCLPGAPLTQDTSLTALYKAGVKVGLSVHEAEDVRQLVWVAGWARSDLGLSDEKAVDFISKNLRELAGLESSKDVVIYDGNPFEFGAKISAIVGGGKTGVFCNPRAF
ncbi:hypothetical protein BGW38_005953 [Lunasporangiospora selenospora]|uniref:Amidohydrolase-related domain-containing protein n=1 Tax=Lunasporangiospora selenospora TaxID=979761 RepID=A0A9P6FN69_9FUNG|nr:hypothetical protein BGW38_005953 [Lunasporangiospora selenospora]